MQQVPPMTWICPDCQHPNETRIAPDAEAGGTVDVRCGTCGAGHEASVFFALHPSGSPRTIGVVWA